MKKIINETYPGRGYKHTNVRREFNDALIDMIDSDPNDEVCIEFNLECLLGMDGDEELCKSFPTLKHLYDWIYIRVTRWYGMSRVSLRSKKLNDTTIRIWFFKQG